MKQKRQLYIDNLRIFIISLVVLHHLAITYGASGMWYYVEGQAGAIGSILLSLFVATNQSFFMGLLFFVSAFFTNKSYDRRGGTSFLTSRMKRLGIPLILYFFILNPITAYLAARFGRKADISFFDGIREGWGFGFGPLWFVEVLLLFAVIFVVMKSVKKNILTNKDQKPLPGDFSIILVALSIGIISFVTRLFFPVGWNLEPFGFQLGFFPQYIAMLILGPMAQNRGWLESLTYKRAMRWFIAAQVMIFFAFPTVFYLGGAIDGNVEAFFGGWTIQSLMYSLWEQVTGISLMIGVLGIFRHRLAGQNKTGSRLSDSAFAVYVFHPPIVVAVAVSFKWLAWPLLLKFTVLAIPVLFACFGISYLIKKAPIGRTIF